jgi:hypothetical protein
MAQFRIYQSTDSGAPTLNGLTGSLLALLDACLVNGYGSQIPAGWLKPIPNTGSFGCFQLPSGSTGHYLFVGDSGSNGQGGAEAYLQGWDSITNFNEFAVTGSNQFPTLAQLAVGRGSVIARKSAAPTAVGRTWIVMADSRSLYGFVQTGDVANAYYGFMFGEFYSIKSGSVDTGRTMIVGRSIVSSSVASTERLDTLGTTMTTAVAGHFAAHAFGGGGSSITLNVHGDPGKSAGTTLLGQVTYLNNVDNGLYISPVWVVDNATANIRGRMRGFYQYLHAIANVVDGQTFTGSADFPGRTFEVIKQTGNGPGVYFMETSDTLETN